MPACRNITQGMVQWLTNQTTYRGDFKTARKKQNFIAFTGQFGRVTKILKQRLCDPTVPLKTVESAFQSHGC